MKNHLTLIAIVALAIVVGLTGGYLSRTLESRALSKSHPVQADSRPLSREQMARLIAQTAAQSAARAAGSVVAQAAMAQHRVIASAAPQGVTRIGLMQVSSDIK